MSELKGKIYKINDTKVVSDKFKKREWVLETDDQYPQFVLMEFIQDKCDILDKYKVGDVVTAYINIKGNNWTNPEGVEKTFNTLQSWRIEKDEQEQDEPEATPDKEGDDLPF